MILRLRSLCFTGTYENTEIANRAPPTHPPSSFPLPCSPAVNRAGEGLYGRVGQVGVAGFCVTQSPGSEVLIAGFAGFGLIQQLSTKTIGPTRRVAELQLCNLKSLQWCGHGFTTLVEPDSIESISLCVFNAEICSPCCESFLSIAKQNPLR